MNRHVVWYQEEEEYEYYNSKKRKQHKPPKKKQKKDCDVQDSGDDTEDDDEEEIITEFSLETINEFSIPAQFRPGVEVGFRKSGEEFDFDMKYSHCKMATILTCIGSEQYTPDVWSDVLSISICDSRDKILASTHLTVAALCLCIRFNNFDELYSGLFDSEKSKTSRLAISTLHNSEHPQCYFENLDDSALAKNGTFEWVCSPGRNCWLPNHSWDTHHGEFSEIRYRAILSKGKCGELSIEKHSIYKEFP